MTMINLGNLSADDLLLINACADPTVFIRSYCHLYDNERSGGYPSPSGQRRQRRFEPCRPTAA